MWPLQSDSELGTFGHQRRWPGPVVTSYLERVAKPLGGQVDGICGATDLPRRRTVRDSLSARPVMWCGHHADLWQEAEHIFLRLLLDQLAIGNTVNNDRGRHYVVAGARGTGQ